MSHWSEYLSDRSYADDIGESARSSDLNGYSELSNALFVPGGRDEYVTEQKFNAALDRSLHPSIIGAVDYHIGERKGVLDVLSIFITYLSFVSPKQLLRVR